MPHCLDGSYGWELSLQDWVALAMARDNHIPFSKPCNLRSWPHIQGLQAGASEFACRISCNEVRSAAELTLARIGVRESRRD